METSGIESELADLGGVGLDECLSFDVQLVADSMRRLLSRIDNPMSSVGGYNPQRDE